MMVHDNSLWHIWIFVYIMYTCTSLLLCSF
nr:MAG TPA: transmembrane protein [Bacteriophage sp.]